MSEHSQHVHIAATAGFTVRLQDCSTITVEADDATTRSDGSLWLLQHDEPPRQGMPKLAPTLVLAAREWVAVWPANVPSPFAPPDDDAEPPNDPPPRFLAQATDIPDPLGRRQAIAERLATLNPET